MNGLLRTKGHHLTVEHVQQFQVGSQHTMYKC